MLSSRGSIRAGILTARGVCLNRFLRYFRLFRGVQQAAWRQLTILFGTQTQKPAAILIDPRPASKHR
jgi:hypothetical protein